jgi:hypothetical protein
MGLKIYTKMKNKRYFARDYQNTIHMHAKMEYFIYTIPQNDKFQTITSQSMENAREHLQWLP